jgi:glutathione synthase/RimK-type ligase-like ATP-grasp enzyme
MEELRLTFGAIDLIETPEGEYVFLEVNPNGQWLWLDDMLKLGISDAVADWLGVASQP